VDTETRAYLDAALESLRLEIRAGGSETAMLRQELKGEIGELRQEMRAETGALRAETGALRGEVGSLREETGALRVDVGSLRAETGALRGDVGSLRAETGVLRVEVGSLREETGALRTEMGTLRGETSALRVETGSLRAESGDLRQEMRQAALGTRRHFDVVAESIRSDVRVVAEGVAANTEAIERLGTDLRPEMDSRFTAYHAVVRVAFRSCATTSARGVLADHSEAVVRVAERRGQRGAVRHRAPRILMPPGAAP
jgi:chromosome segregation ATPase